MVVVLGRLLFVAEQEATGGAHRSLIRRKIRRLLHSFIAGLHKTTVRNICSWLNHFNRLQDVVIPATNKLALAENCL